MAKRMLIDATHPEETRVVVVDGNRLEEFDFETSTKKQIKGNIYLAKVTRVEPSLQACFVDYGGNRHGFLAFNEIHPDYWRIPIADRQALLADHGESDGGADAARRISALTEIATQSELGFEQPVDLVAPARESSQPPAPAEGADPTDEAPPYFDRGAEAAPSEAETAHSAPESFDAPPIAVGDNSGPEPAGEPAAREADATPAHPVESIGGDDIDEEQSRRRFRSMRHYKIQEVIKRRQVLLVQVVKEERGTKGAALTTYLSLAGRYCVLMPNTARGGGISRRITSAMDRKRLKSIMEDLQVPDGMAVILRTAGMERTKAEIKRDYEYLMRIWEEVRELTLRSTAPALVYEEGNLIKRAIRDLYSRDIEEIDVEGEEGFKAARAFMKLLMPSHTNRIQLYNDPGAPVMQRYGVEAQLDEIHNPTVRLRSGGYIVINQTEALVAIDVNSGKATRERHIEETAYRTNLEAADEIARQLRLRDLAGLIVIDFIDMEDQHNQQSVERRVKEAMKSDRARIQIGRISAFGLLELSRQRLRPSLMEVSSERCPHCEGTGFIRSTESAALHVLRGIEEEAHKGRAGEIRVHVPTAVALYLLNEKRASLAGIEQRHALRVSFERDEALIPPAFKIERLKSRPVEAPPLAVTPSEPPPAILAGPSEDVFEAPAEAAEADEESQAFAPANGQAGEGGDDGGRRRRRRRRRRRGRGSEERGPAPMNGGLAETGLDAPIDAAEADMPADLAPVELIEPGGSEHAEPGTAPSGDIEGETQEQHRRRRGRRGGRRRRNRGERPFQPGDVVAQPIEEPIVEVHVPTAPVEITPPPRVRGPGDDYDWPWNRRQDIEAVADTPPEPVPPEPIHEPERMQARERMPPPVVVEEQTPEPPPPSGSSRRGWWKRLTNPGN